MARLGKRNLKPIGLPAKLSVDIQLRKLKFAKPNGYPMSESGGEHAGYMLDELKDFDEIAIYPFYRHAV